MTLPFLRSIDNPHEKTVVVGLSGGVDSSVSALLLKEAGFRVIGLFMKNWDDDECPSAIDHQDVAAVCEQIQIPFYTIDFSKEYYEEVFSSFITGLKAGLTPNPDVLCNRQIKFDHFLQKALLLGADYIATGHYCQSFNGDLYKGFDSNKDQSYFLHAISKQALKKTLFPVGHLEKPQVRELARKHRIVVSEKKDSTGICFIGKRNFRDFMQEYLPVKNGPFINIDTGKIVGSHVGAHFYTLGQRKGLGIGGAGNAWFVVKKDHKNNIVYVAQGDDHPQLYSSTLTAILPSFLTDFPIDSEKVAAKIRYRQKDEPCQVTFLPDQSLRVVFDNPQRAITPGQSIVFYKDDLCLGGAFIA